MSSHEESDAEYFSRRAMEENRVAASARSNRAIAAHRHIAVAYAMRLAEELKMERALDELLIGIEAASHYSMQTPAPGGPETPSNEAENPDARVVVRQVGQDGGQLAA